MRGDRADGRRWFLINASPDVRVQIESFPPLHPPTGSVRGTAIAGVLLTNADLDHTLGLLNLRESGPLVIHAPACANRSLKGSISTQYSHPTAAYNGAPLPQTLAPLHYADGHPAASAGRVRRAGKTAAISAGCHRFTGRCRSVIDLWMI